MNIEHQVAALRKISLYYSLLCALFLILSSQFTGAILPLLFIIPIIMGSISVKRRRKSGYLIAMAVIPLAFSIAVMWIRYAIVVFSDSANQFAFISTNYNISLTVAIAMTIIFFLLSLAMISISALLFVKLRKNKELFI